MILKCVCFMFKRETIHLFKIISYWTSLEKLHNVDICQSNIRRTNLHLVKSKHVIDFDVVTIGHVCRQYNETYLHHVISELTRVQPDWISEEEKTQLLLCSSKYQVHRS